MSARKSTFALFFGTRALFPASLIRGARQELGDVLKKWGHGTLLLDENATRHGAVETTREGQVYAEFLRANRGQFDGVIVCLANFGDETGAVAALKDAGVPILIQAYPDEIGRMGPEQRRDAYCGKLSVMDVCCQYGVKFTALKPHTVHPTSERFRQNVDHFDRVCQVVRGMRGMVVGAIGARTTPFKTVRIDEAALQRHGVTVETLDLSGVIARVKALSDGDAACKAKADALRAYANWSGAPGAALDNLVRLAVVLDALIDEYQMDAVAIRCWTELQQELGISPCVVMSTLNEAGCAAACEVDVGNAVLMRALALASGGPVALLDWNNNYGDDDEKCILFHCSAVPAGMMTGPGRIEDHPMLARVVGDGRGFGCNVGRLAPQAFTYGGLLTADGRVKCYLGQGEITKDPIPPEFFGCAGVARISGLQDVLLYIGRTGQRHHVSVTPGQVQAPLHEALEHYLGFEVAVPSVAQASCR